MAMSTLPSSNESPDTESAPKRGGGAIGIGLIFVGLIVAGIGTQDCGVDDTASCVTRFGAHPIVLGAGVLLVLIGIAVLTGLADRFRSDDS